jgi:hypothetical protein
LDIVRVDHEGVKAAAKFVRGSLVFYLHARLKYFDHIKVSERIAREQYTPNSWRDQPLHLLPPIKYDPDNPRTRATLDWVFFVSALNFSFWSDLTSGEGGERYAVLWREGWETTEDGMGKRGQGKEKRWEGYWSLLAAISRGKFAEAELHIMHHLTANYSLRGRNPNYRSQVLLVS